MNKGDLARFTLYGEDLGLCVVTGKAGSPSDAYQYFVQLEDGRDFVATAEELEQIK